MYGKIQDSLVPLSQYFNWKLTVSDEQFGIFLKVSIPIQYEQNV